MAGLPYNVRVNVTGQFPALVVGAAGIKVTKQANLWTIQPDFSALQPQVPPANQFPFTYVELWNSASGVYTRVSLSTLSALTGSPSYTLVQSPGTYVALSTDNILLINRTAPAAGFVALPPSETRNGFPIVVKDIAGNASTYPTTVQFSGAETCDGLSTVDINADFNGYKFWPLTTGGWFISP